MTSKLVFATRNRGKLVELRALLAGVAGGVELLTLDDVGFPGEVDEDQPTLAGNARKKAVEVARATGLLALADDSGLEVDALGGAPGVYSARYAGEDPRSDARNNEKLLAALAGVPAERRAARFRCVLALAGPDPAPDVILAEGTCEGAILDGARGTGGFGYDPLFLVPARGLAMAELSSDEKNAISHRAAAMRAMLPHLVARLTATGSRA
jgi:XTP/dITP diphosphohydrolase